MAEMRGCDLLVDYLIREQTPYIFGYAGHGAVGLLDGVYQRQDEIKVVWPRMESAVGFMADASFRATASPSRSTRRPGRARCCSRSRSARRWPTRRRSWRSPARSRPTSSTAARCRRSTTSSPCVYFEWFVREAFGARILSAEAFTAGLVQRGILSLGMG